MCVFGYGCAVYVLIISRTRSWRGALCPQQCRVRQGIGRHVFGCRYVSSILVNSDSDDNVAASSLTLHCTMCGATQFFSRMYFSLAFFADNCFFFDTKILESSCCAAKCKKRRRHFSRIKFQVFCHTLKIIFLLWTMTFSKINTRCRCPAVPFLDSWKKPELPAVSSQTLWPFSKKIKRARECPKQPTFNVSHMQSHLRKIQPQKRNLCPKLRTNLSLKWQPTMDNQCSDKERVHLALSLTNSGSLTYFLKENLKMTTSGVTVKGLQELSAHALEWWVWLH